MNVKNLDDIWQQVPVDYYQEGVKTNILQRIWHGRKLSLLKQILKDKKFDNCLDIGCASGHMLSGIQENYPNSKYTGVDVYEKAISFAKNKYPKIEFIVADGQNLPFKTNSFDLIVNYETIEHVEDPLQVLTEIKRVLKKDGLAVVTMDSGSLLFRIVWYVWENTKGQVWKGAHLHPFVHTELEQIIKKAGFKIKSKIFSHLGMEVTFVLKK